MAGRYTISAGKGGHKSVTPPPMRPGFELGTRPQSLRSQPLPRIKPLKPNTRNYGKADQPDQSPFGNTGLTGET